MLGASIGSAFLLLFLLGLFTLLLMNLHMVEKNLAWEMEIHAFLKPNITMSELVVLKGKITSLPQVQSVTYIDKDEALKRLEKGLNRKINLTGLMANPLSPYFSIKVKNLDDIPTVASTLRKLSGITTVSTLQETAKRFAFFFSILENLFFGLVVFLFFGFLFIIYHTIRLGVYSRKKEIEIMQLIGAEPHVVRWPFILEGAFYGFLGALLAVFSLIPAYQSLVMHLSQAFPLFPIVDKHTAVFMLWTFPFVGMLMGSMGGLLSVNRHLHLGIPILLVALWFCPFGAKSAPLRKFSSHSKTAHMKSVSALLAKRKALLLKRKKMLEIVKKKLWIARHRLQAANSHEKEVRHQLREAWANLHKITDNLNTVSVELRTTRLNLQFTRQRLRYLQYDYNKKQRRLAENLQTALESQPSPYALLTNPNANAMLLDSSYDLSKILTAQIASAKLEKAKQKEIGLQEGRLTSEMQEIHALQNNAKIQYQAYANIAAQRQALLNQAKQEKAMYERQVGQLEEISDTLEKQLQELIRGEEAKLRASNPDFGSSEAFLWPIASHMITSPFGWRYHPIFHRELFHTGVDIAAPYDTPIHAAADGIVIYAGWYGGYGNAVVIDHGHGLSTLYAHCSVILVRKGEMVRRGETIAEVGSTGYATGPHLHFEIRVNGNPINPLARF
jgi:murein DD-endopeptidase MepM/ murein hydrolase activator NlpD/cell division protein FtsX